MSIVDEAPFTLVKSKRQKSKNSSSYIPRNCHQFRSKNLLPASTVESTTFNKTVELRKIADSTSKIKDSDYFQQTIEILTKETKKPPTTIVCFGIGLLRENHISRYQFAYILAVKSYFDIKSIQFHEPLLNDHDKDLLNSLNCDLFSTNIEGKLKLDASETTLVFLPHCPKQLTNNLLWKNWSVNGLRHLILISNSFRSTVEQTASNCIAQDAGFISRIAKYTTEISLRNSFEHKNVFNDIAIHFFDIQNCEEDFFEDCEEPTYGLSELIEAADSLSIG